MQNISNNQKASLYFDDIRETKVKREQGFTLQQFHYECARKRNDRGMPYGPTQTTILQLQIKSLPSIQSRVSRSFSTQPSVQTKEKTH